MKQNLITDVIQGMLPYLNNAQTERLQEVLQYTLFDYEVTKIKKDEELSEQNLVESFLSAKRIEGCSEKTLKYYNATIQAMLDGIGKSIKYIVTDDIRCYLTEYQAKKKSSKVTIDNIRRILSSFFSWLEDEDYILKSPVRRIHKVKTGTNIKETYSDEELMLLLKKPDKNCTFNEYRTWVIINLLLNNGCRASSIRCIQIQDVDLENRQIILRHTKNGKMQAIPLCSMLIPILREYLATRGGSPSDYLFCTQYGDQLGRDTLRNSIARYNKSRGVEKTSTHLFRHTFARKYLVDCGGDAFALQRLLGHSSLKMTKHYCAIYDSDLANNYDNFSPLAKMKQPKERIKRR